MQLSDWLAKKELTLEQFGELIGKSAPTVSRLARGIGSTDFETIRKIVNVTKGAVTERDLIQAEQT